MEAAAAPWWIWPIALAADRVQTLLQVVVLAAAAAGVFTGGR